MTTPSLRDLHVSNPTHQTQQNRISNITYLSGSGGVTEKKYHASAKLGPYSTNTVREKKIDAFGRKKWRAGATSWSEHSPPANVGSILS